MRRLVHLTARSRARQSLSGARLPSPVASRSSASKSDQNLYRSRDEIREWQQRDPIQFFVNYLISEHVLSEEEVKNVAASAYTTIEEAYQFAIGSPDPDADTLFEGVYA